MSEAELPAEEESPEGWSGRLRTPPWFPILWPFGDNFLIVLSGVMDFPTGKVGMLKVRPLSDDARAEEPPSTQEGMNERWEQLREDMTLHLTFDTPESAESLAGELMALAAAMRTS